jgi:hypothetical protein
MNIPQKKLSGAKTTFKRPKYHQGLVMPREEIERLVDTVPIGEAKAAAAHLIAISRAAQAIEKGDSLDRNLRVINQLARQIKSRALKRLLKQVVAAVARGDKRGSYAAWGSIRAAYFWAFEYLPDWDAGERLYEERLRQMTQEA